MNKVNESLSERFSNLLRLKGITQADIARHFGVSKSFITNIVKGNRLMSVGMLVAFADFFGCSVDYLLGRTDNPEINR